MLQYVIPFQDTNKDAPTLITQQGPPHMDALIRGYPEFDAPIFYTLAWMGFHGYPDWDTLGSIVVSLFTLIGRRQCYLGYPNFDAQLEYLRLDGPVQRQCQQGETCHKCL